MAIFCTLLGHSVASWSLKYLPAPFVSTVQLLDCVFSTLWGILLFREIPSAITLLGGVLCVSGIAFYSRLTMNKESIMITAVVNKRDAAFVCDALRDNRVSFTEVSSSGGFLRTGKYDTIHRH